jgi:multicomponent Na+:H+ antiporter subunit D
MIEFNVSPPLLAIYIPLIGAFLIALAGRWPNLREAITLITAGALLYTVGGIVPRVLADDFWQAYASSPPLRLIQVLPGVFLELKVEPLGMLFALIASSLWILNSLYSIGYMRGNREHHQTRFYVCFALAISSVMGLAFAGNLFTLFVFYEMLTLTTYPLVAHKGTAEALRSRGPTSASSSRPRCASSWPASSPPGCSPTTCPSSQAACSPRRSPPAR